MSLAHIPSTPFAPAKKIGFSQWTVDGALKFKWLNAESGDVHGFMEAADKIVADCVRWTQLFLAMPDVAERVAPSRYPA